MFIIYSVQTLLILLNAILIAQIIVTDCRNDIIVLKNYTHIKYAQKRVPGLFLLFNMPLKIHIIITIM